jgi:SNF2 family DNA or RNA helicase
MNDRNLEFNYDIGKLHWTIPYSPEAHRSLSALPGWTCINTDGEVMECWAPLYPSSFVGFDAVRMAHDLPEFLCTADEHALLLTLKARASMVKHELQRVPFYTGDLNLGNRKLKRHQYTAVRALHLMGWSGIIGDEMGLGKTTVAIAAANGAEVERVLILCPALLKGNWGREIKAVFPDDIVNGIPSHKTAREAIFRSLMRDSAGKPKWLIMNYDLLLHISGEQLKWLQAFADGNMVICDESHYLKNWSAKRTKLSRTVMHDADHRLLLTGTPIMNTPTDLFSQISLVQPGTWGTKSEFERRHVQYTRMTVNGRSFRKITGTKDLEGLNKIVNTVMIRRKKEDVINLPPKVRTFPHVDLPRDIEHVYKQMRDYACLELEAAGDANIFSPQASTAAEAVMRLEQIAQGFVGGIPEKMTKLFADKHYLFETIPGRSGELIIKKHPKLMLVMELSNQIKDQGGIPVVMSRFNAPLEWLATQWMGEHGPDCRIIDGSCYESQREKTLELFSARQLTALFCQVGCAQGWNGTASQDMIFLGRHPCPAINHQAEDRLHRIGTTGTVNIQIPIVNGTIETLLDRRLASKSETADNVLKMTAIELRKLL